MKDLERLIQLRGSEFDYENIMECFIDSDRYVQMSRINSHCYSFYYDMENAPEYRIYFNDNIITYIDMYCK